MTRALCRFLLLFFVCAWPAMASAEDASDHFRRGVELFEEGNHRAAIIEFERAYELKPNWRVLYNIGQVHFLLQDYSAALKAFERYLAEGGDEVPSKRRAVVEADLEKLEKRVAKLTLNVSVPGAEISIDDVVVGTSPLAGPVGVNAGRRKVTVSKADHQPVTRMVDIAGGDIQTLSLELVKLTTAEPEPAPPPAAPSPAPQRADKGEVEPESHVNVPFWTSLAITGVLGIGATITGVLALRSKSDLDEELDTFPGNSDAINAARDDVSSLSAATDVLIALTVAGAVVTVVFAFTGGDDEQTALIVGPGSLGVSRSF